MSHDSVNCLAHGGEQCAVKLVVVLTFSGSAALVAACRTTVVVCNFDARSSLAS